MKNFFSRRGFIRLCSYIIAAAIAFGTTYYLSGAQVADYRQSIENSYQRSLNDLDNYMSHIETTLSKGIYANTPPMIAGLASSLLRDASAAKSCLSQLPVSNWKLENIYRFLSQVGEFNMSLSRKVSEGQALIQEDRDQLTALSKVAGKLREQLGKIVSDIYEKGVSLTDIQAGIQVNDIPAGEEETGTPAEGEKEEVVNYPKLIYDGPFSEHILNPEPALTKALPEVGREEARQAAAAFLQLGSEELRDDDDGTGIIPSYWFHAGESSIGVTRQGGFVYSLINPRFAGESVIPQSEAVRIAQIFLIRNNLKSMKESYYYVNDGICIVNFAYSQDGIVYYPDLIKVGVALDSGEVVSFDANGYVMNHKKRELPAPRFRFEEAKSVLSPNLTVLDYGRAVIPTTGNGEELCYEFHCQGIGGDELLVYISTSTCRESQILLLLHTDGGILTR